MTTSDSDRIASEFAKIVDNLKSLDDEVRASWARRTPEERTTVLLNYLITEVTDKKLLSLLSADIKFLTGSVPESEQVMHLLGELLSLAGAVILAGVHHDLNAKDDAVLQPIRDFAKQRYEGEPVGPDPLD